MQTVVQSCRLEKNAAKLLSRQAKRRHLEVSTLSSLYLSEKALEEEFPGIGFRDAAGGREAYVLGHRVAVWEVVEVHREAKTIARTADHFGWPDYLVKFALANAKAFPGQIAAQSVGSCQNSQSRRDLNHSAWGWRVGAPTPGNHVPICLR